MEGGDFVQRVVAGVETWVLEPGQAATVAAFLGGFLGLLLVVQTGLLTYYMVFRITKILLPLFGAMFFCTTLTGLGHYLLLVLNLQLLLHFLAKKFRSERRKTGDKSMKLRVLLVGDAFPPELNGVSTFAVHAIEKLQEKGHKVHVLCSINKDKELMGAGVTSLPGLVLDYCPQHSISAPVPTTCFHTLYTFKPDVVHMYEFGWLTAFMTIYCWLVGVPVCWSHHTRTDLYFYIIKFPWYVPLFSKFILFYFVDVFCPYFATGHLTVCKFLHDKYIRYGFRNVRMWKTGVDTKFKPENYSDEMRKRLAGDRPDLPLVVHVGRISPDKQSEEIFPVLQKAYEMLDGKIRFGIVGDGEPRKEMERLFKEANVPVVFTGFLTGDELRSSYASADLFFSPSATETYPIVFLEAMRSGVAVVGPKDTGSADTFINGVHGTYYERNENMAENGAKAIIETLENLEKYRNAGAAHVKTLTWEAVIEEMDEMLYHIADTAISSKKKA